MAEYRHLNNAPINEAVIDLRVKIPPDFDVETFAELKVALADQYPDVKEMKFFGAQIGMEGGEPVIKGPDAGLKGYVFKANDQKRVA